MKEVIAARANYSQKHNGQVGRWSHIYKSYISDIHPVEIRQVPGHVAGYYEVDYTFKYRGTTYRINDHLVGNANGDRRFSAEHRYTLEVI